MEDRKEREKLIIGGYWRGEWRGESWNDVNAL